MVPLAGKADGKPLRRSGLGIMTDCIWESREKAGVDRGRSLTVIVNLETNEADAVRLVGVHRRAFEGWDRGSSHAAKVFGRTVVLRGIGDEGYLQTDRPAAGQSGLSQALLAVRYRNVVVEVRYARSKEDWEGYERTSPASLRSGAERIARDVIGRLRG